MPVNRRASGALIAVVTLGAVVVGYLKPDPTADRTEVRALVANAGALGVIGADVRVAGTPVGQVTGRRRAGAAAEITMEVDRSVGTVHADASLAVRPRLAFEGPGFVDLQPGSPGAPPLGGRAIGLDATTVATSLDTVLRLADRPTRTAVQGSVRGLRGAIPPRALNRTLDRAPQLLRDVGSSARAMQGPRPESLRRAVSGFSATAGAVARRERDLAPLAQDVATTAAALDRPALDGTLDDLPATAAALRDGGVTLDGTLARLAPLARELRPAARRLGPSLERAAPLLREAAPALERARPLVRDARGSVSAAARAAPATRRTLAALDPTLRTLDATLLDDLTRETDLGVPAFVAFLNLFGGGGGASAPYTTGGSGSGHFMRFGFRFLTGLGLPAPPCSLLAKVQPQLAASLSTAGLCTP